MSVEEIQAKRENVFASFDADENAVLIAEEYALFDEARANDQENHGKGEGKFHEGMTLEFNDVDGNGEVSLDEFVGQSAAWLEMADQNGDGVISSDDFGQH